MDSADLFLIAVAWTLATISVARGADARHVAGFAELYAVPLTTETTDLIRSTLTRTRRFRAIGAAATVTAGTITIARFAGWWSVGLWTVVGLVAVGFGLGLVVDELTRPDLSTSSPVATLERRSVRTYVERWVIAFGVFMLAVVVVQLWFAIDLGRVDGLLTPDTTSNGFSLRGQAVVAIGLFLAVVLSAIGLLLPRLVRRRFDATEPERAAVFHALRTSAVSALVGAALLVVGVTAGLLARYAALEDSATNAMVQWTNNLSILVSAASVAFGASLPLFATPRRGTVRARTADESSS